jgi:hypothetical protein
VANEDTGAAFAGGLQTMAPDFQRYLAWLQQQQQQAPQQPPLPQPDAMNFAPRTSVSLQPRPPELRTHDLSPTDAVGYMIGKALDPGTPGAGTGPTGAYAQGKRLFDAGQILSGPVGVGAGVADLLHASSKAQAGEGSFADAALAAPAAIPGPGGKAARAVGKAAKGALAEARVAREVPIAPEPTTGDVAAMLDRARDYTKRKFAKPGAPESFDVDAKPNKSVQTVRDPYRMGFPGIYADPREIARIANERVIPEDPSMKRLWGVTRGDLTEMAKGRVGNEAPVVPPAGPRSRGSLAAENVMTPKNEQRIQDILYEGGKYPGLQHADAWYINDPMYHRMAEIMGPEEAKLAYRKLNQITGMASPGSDVLTEVQRGTAAHWLDKQGRFEDFKKYGGVAEDKRAGMRDFPEDMRYIGGHPYHPTAQALPMERYLATGEVFNSGPKVPLYTQASGTPETGFQTKAPVGDAHWSRGVGLSDTRKGPTDVQGSFSTSEYQTLQPWWQQKIAEPLGLEGVPAQARLWTILGPQTGVDSPLGQGKLELISQQIMKAAARLGISPEKARDLILTGGAGAGVLAAMAPGLGNIAAEMTNSEQPTWR